MGGRKSTANDGPQGVEALSGAPPEGWGGERDASPAATRLAALARALGPAGAARLEIIGHQHVPIFHTEHCVFARFMSGGNSYKDW